MHFEKDNYQKLLTEARERFPELYSTSWAPGVARVFIYISPEKEQIEL